MRHLHVALYSLHGNELRLNCFEEREQLLAALEILRANPERRIAVDLGFGPFDPRSCRPVFDQLEWPVLVSDRAAPLFHDLLSPDKAEFATVGDTTFYGALWTSRESQAESGTMRLDTQARGWVAGLLRSEPALFAELKRAGIVDESSYQAKEATLSGAMRVSLARARYVSLAGSPPTPFHVLDNLAACPPWVLSRRFRELSLTTRQANALRAHTLDRVADLVRLGTTGLLKLPNLGLKSVRELGETIYELTTTEPGAIAVASAESPPELPVEEYRPSSFSEALRETLRDQGGIAEAVVGARWGLGCPKRTLQDLALDYGVTRERIRQIEVKAVEKLAGASVWPCMGDHIEAMLTGRHKPLRVADLPREDPWFGSAEALDAIELTIHRFLAGRLHVFTLDGDSIVSAISERNWGRCLEDARLILGAPDGYDHLDRGKRLVDAMLVERGAELRSSLLRQLGLKDQPEQLGMFHTPAPEEADDMLALKLRSELLRRDLLREA